MDIIMLLNVLATLVISTIYMASYQKRVIKMSEFIFKNIDSNETNLTESIQNTQTHIIAATWLIIISGITLTIGFTALYIFQSKYSFFPLYVQTFISSGLYVPVFLLIIGFIINLSYKVYTKKSSNLSLSPLEIKTIVFIMAIIINIPLTTLGWQLGLFVFAIILGKFVWIDFIFDIKSLIAVILNTFQKREDSGVDILCFQYALYFYPIFFVPAIANQLWIKNISDISNKLLFFLTIYISTVSMCTSYLHGVDIANASFKINFNKIKK